MARHFPPDTAGLGAFARGRAKHFHGREEILRDFKKACGRYQTRDHVPD